MGWDDRFVAAFYFFISGTVIFEPLGFVATLILCPILGFIGFIVGGRTTAYKASRGL